MIMDNKMTKIFVLTLILFVIAENCDCGRGHDKLKEVLSWKQIGYNINGFLYSNSSDYEYNPHAIYFDEELEDRDRFFIQPNNVPIGFEVYKDKIFVTVPRRRYGIPSTLNYVTMGEKSPYLKPYPDLLRSRDLYSVYRPRVDVCDRLWMVDTGHLEVPNDRRQVQPPAIVIFDLKTDTQVHRHKLHPSVLVNNRTSAGLTSITVEVDPQNCGDAFAYINDLATEGLVVYSLKEDKSWRVEHQSFRHNEASMNFTAAGHVINWRDGIFSVALARRDGDTLAFYHPLVSTQEFAISTSKLKSRAPLNELNADLGDSGPNTQRGSHDFHSPTNTMFFANVAQAAILCWNINTVYNKDNIQIVAQDTNKLGYVSDLKVRGDDVWLLANQIPKFVYNTQNINEYNYFVMRGSVQELLAGTRYILPI